MIYLFKSEGLDRFADLLGDTTRTTPISFRNLVERWSETESVIAIVTAIAEQHGLFCISSSTIVANVIL